jgi:pimeloyl-ACP methyl ester carboxylesterase
MNRRSETIAAGASIETYVEGQARYRGAGTAPVFEIFAALDPLNRCNEWADLRTRYGGRITSAVINDASHALFNEQPDAVAAAIIGYLRVHRRLAQ